MNIPEIIGYKIERKIGEGATADVYLGTYEKLVHKRAVKVLKPELLNASPYARRVIREARIASKLDHPGIVQIYDVEQNSKLSYIVMEYLGESLKDKIESAKAMPVEDVFKIIKQVAEALDYAHSQGIFHRDIKPANILFKDDGTAVLVDFGLALDNDPGETRTMLHHPEGTGYYMSPEQCKGEKGDAAGDFYSLGVVLFQMLVGKLPYKSDNFLAVVNMHINSPVPRLPVRLSRYQSLIDQLMAKDREQRLINGLQLRELIEQLTAKENMQKRVKEDYNVPIKYSNQTPIPRIYPGKVHRKKIDILKVSLIGAIIGFLIVLSFMIYNSIGAPTENSKFNKNEKSIVPIPKGDFNSTSSTSTKRDKIPSPTQLPKITGGVIKFEPGNSSLSDDQSVILSITEPLKTSKGENIDADIYYTLDGSEPTKENGEKYRIGEPLVFQETGSVTIKARAIARVGKYEGEVYSKGYVIDCGPIIGGEITFLKPGGNYIDSVEIPLSYKTLKFARGKALLGEIRYTLDGSDPTRTNGSLYKEGELVVLSREGKYTLKARVFSRDGNYEAPKEYSQTYTIQKKEEPPPPKPRPVEVIGGSVRYDKAGGEYKAPLQVQLSFDTLRFSGGEEIDSEIYYTTDGREPTRTNGKRYSPGESIGLVIEGTYEIKTKVISTDGCREGKVYSRKYTIKKPSPPSPGRLETVTNVDDLDQKNIKDVLDRIEKIDIDLSGIEKVSKLGMLQIKIMISQRGEARLVEILDFTAEPAEKFAEIKSALDKEIQSIKFPPLTRQGKPVNAELVVNFKIVRKYNGIYMIRKNKFDM